MTIDKYPKSQTGLTASKPKIRVGEGTSTIPLPALSGQHAKTVQDLQSNANVKHKRGHFK